jgi:hypothetical protein
VFCILPSIIFLAVPSCACIMLPYFLPAGPVRPFVSVDICPWDRAELPEWQEALRAACRQWQLDAAEALAAGGPRAEALHDLAEESEQYLWAGARLLMPGCLHLCNRDCCCLGRVEPTPVCTVMLGACRVPTSILLRSIC